ncbi:MAG: hypothetical protein AAB612_00200, partial [Patescibacteria group bacterium]
MNGLFSATTQVFYTYFLKPIFFQFDPEFAHNQNVLAGKTLGKIPFAKKCIDWMWAYHNPVLTKTIDGITFPNPVGLSAGFDYNGNLTNILPSVGFGFHTIGTVTLKSYVGNTPPRLGRFVRSRALLVNKGLKNDGAIAIIKKLKKCRFEIPTGISIASTNQYFNSEKEQIKDIVECFSLFETSKLSHAYYELNISCPNTFGGEPFTSPARLNKLMRKMDHLNLSRPLYIKMPIDQSEKETLSLLNILSKHNTQGVIFGNLTKDKTNPAVHPEDRKVWLTRKGNLSGKPTWQRSNTLVALTRKHF